MLMNFGPINQHGGEKRLNVIFSRAKHHMALVSSIRHHDITNDYNDGANSLKNFLQYAEAVSKGDAATARRVLENLNPLSRKALAPLTKGDAVVERLAAALRSRGYSVDLNVGQSKFRCDLAVRGNSDSLYQLGILVDTDGHYANPNLLDRYLMQPSILRAFGWRFALVLTKDWYHNLDDVLSRIEKLLQGRKCWRNLTLKTKNLPNRRPWWLLKRRDRQDQFHLCRFRNRLQSLSSRPFWLQFSHLVQFGVLNSRVAHQGNFGRFHSQAARSPFGSVALAPRASRKSKHSPMRRRQNVRRTI
jgi:hypothetical protein